MQLTYPNRYVELYTSSLVHRSALAHRGQKSQILGELESQGGCESLAMHAGNWIQILGKSCTYLKHSAVIAVDSTSYIETMKATAKQCDNPGDHWFASIKFIFTCIKLWNLWHLVNLKTWAQEQTVLRGGFSYIWTWQNCRTMMKKKKKQEKLEIICKCTSLLKYF